MWQIGNNHLTREEILTRAQGFKGESFTRGDAVGALPVGTADTRMTLMGLRGGDVVTNIYVQVTTVGASLTIGKVGVWSTSGTLLGSSANMTSEFTALGVRGGALSSPWTCPSDGGYYMGLTVVGTTGPQILRGSSGITGYSGQSLGANPGMGAAAGGRTDIGDITISQSGNAFWVAWA